MFISMPIEGRALKAAFRPCLSTAQQVQGREQGLICCSACCGRCKPALITRATQMMSRVPCWETCAVHSPWLNRGLWYDVPSPPLCSSKWQVGGLASENVRWAEAVQKLKQQERKLCGDILLTAASISYLGFFTKRYRQSLLDAAWRPYLSQLQVCLAHVTRELT